MEYDRLAWWRGARMVCCREWGIPPWEFDAAFKAGRIRVGDVKRAVDMALMESRNPVELMETLRPGFKRMMKRQQEINNVNALVASAKLAKAKSKRRKGLGNGG